MAIRIKFDSTYNVESPTFALATRNGRKLGSIPAYNIVFRDEMNSYSELAFKVNKEDSGIEYAHWDKLKDFKLIWCKEWNIWFEIHVETDETNELVKNITAKSLGEAELSQINLYDIEINTEEDITRPDYGVYEGENGKKRGTILYDTEHTDASLLHRIMEKAPHYRVIHVDSTIANIQRTFSFDGTSIYDAFQEIGEEINCLFIIGSSSDSNGNIDRTISVYDLESYCLDCGNRDEFTDVCPKCGSKNISTGYGKDTTIFVSIENLADNITYSTDADSVKNCFKLEAGDDLMTATIRNCNPNGTDYIWYISDELKEDMSKELVDKINSYDDLYRYYQNDYKMDFGTVDIYNNLVQKYQKYNPDLKTIDSPIYGYPALMTAYYNTIDLYTYLESELMPDASLDDTDAKAQAELLEDNLSSVSVDNISVISKYTADSAVLGMAKVIVDSRYQVKVKDDSSSYNETSKQWKGRFIITNYSDEEDTTETDPITVTINENYEEFVKQKIEKLLNKDVYDASISGLFKLELADLKVELKKYCLNRLLSFYDACEACKEILIDQGYTDGQTWADDKGNLYTSYEEKSEAIATEIEERQKDLNIIAVYETDGENKKLVRGFQSIIELGKKYIQNKLNFEKYLGEELWLEFCSFRREDKYSNDNYISDGLNNAELFDRALKFIKEASTEIYKSAELQHSISTTLKNLLVIKKFRPLVKYFETGNWIRIQVDDKIYRLRLLEYEIDFDNLENINVEFSDVMKIKNGITDVKSILSQAQTMATSYDSVKRQASQGAESNSVVNSWFENGLDATNTKIIGSADNQNQVWDSHGMLFRKYDDITDSYDPCQMKIINSTLAITKDNWNTVSTAVGGMYYQDPESGEYKYRYGVNAEVLVGDLILGKELGIYADGGSLKFNDEGLEITNGTNVVKIDPKIDPKKNNEIILISNKNSGKSIFSIDNNGNINLMDKNNDPFAIVAKSDSMQFFYNGNMLGAIGYIKEQGSNRYGLAFDLTRDGSYIGFGYQTDYNEGTYDLKLKYDKDDDAVEIFAKTYMDKGLEVFGNVYMDKGLEVHGSFTNPSDITLKTNIDDTKIDALDKINQIELKEFNWIENNEHEDIGIIAQQLQDILPDLVCKSNKTGKLGIKTTKFIPYLIKAIQELYSLVETKNNS